MEVAIILKEELKKRALSLVQIPDDFQPIVEEYFEDENGKGEAMFSWTNVEQDEGVAVKLDLAGHLTSLTIDRNEEDLDSASLSVEERRERAEQFLLSHYPYALKDLTYDKTKKFTRTYRFYYEQFVMDLPLNHAGCFIDVDSAGRIVRFSYRGVKQVPEIPTSLISKQKLIDHVQARLKFKLSITNLLSVIHDVAEDGLRLVYEIEPYFMKYKADVLTPTLTIIHDEDDPETYVPLPPPSSPTVRKDLSLEEIIGITERMEVIREVDMGEETGMVWRDRDWEMNGNDLSVNGFFKRQTEDTVKAFVSKKTGKVRSFIWFKERDGNLELTREECLQKAIDFLQAIVANYHQYLQLIVREKEEEMDDPGVKEPFTFYIHNGEGIPVHLEIVNVVVNRKTGQIDHYNGPSFGMHQLTQIPTEPAISKKEAREIFSNHLDFELVWNQDYECERESYNLVYQACDRYSRTSIRYIDAMTGAVITARGE